MREILVIGIGPGHPDQITVQAVDALNRAQVLFVVDKGAAKSGLLEVRDEILRRHVRNHDGYRVVEIADPPRDRGAYAYADAVADWHAARADRFAEAIGTELDDDGVGAFLVWGDPALYDSTLRVIDHILAGDRVTFDFSVIAGVTSVHALTAAHRIPLNGIGEPVHITPARRIADGLPDGVDSVVVMLDPHFTAAQLDEPDLEVFWGAYVSTRDEVLISGRLRDVAPQIARTRAELRSRHGWIMDSYLLRRPGR
ncbi:precorrin-6A synthase (deacetylating) [uncultured Jatrophihabitans sp.]|uniref:precorrin-6A synthase (deacetylating) n=1 Tax=uncultured Jatrophihabitans sp. TaxID=1610747 RepID=UPI0035CB67A4